MIFVEIAKNAANVKNVKMRSWPKDGGMAHVRCEASAIKHYLLPKVTAIVHTLYRIVPRLSDLK